METTILFRKNIENEEELQVAEQYFNVVEHRTECYDSLVIGRYSVLPYYQELEFDLAKMGSNLINSYQQHRWIADFEYSNKSKIY